MDQCTLTIDGRLVLTSVGGAPDAEYALFDVADVELRKVNIGVVREIAYRTTVAHALHRLEDLGLSPSLVAATANAVHPLAAFSYARGASSKRVLHALSPAELFDGYRFDAVKQIYEGFFIDIGGLARDLGIPGASTCFQAMSLFSRLHSAQPDAEVVLSTEQIMQARRPGERSHKRIFLGQARDLSTAAESTFRRAKVAGLRTPERRDREIAEVIRTWGLSRERVDDLEIALLSDDGAPVWDQEPVTRRGSEPPFTTRHSQPTLTNEAILPPPNAAARVTSPPPAAPSPSVTPSPIVMLHRKDHVPNSPVYVESFEIVEGVTAATAAPPPDPVSHESDLHVRSLSPEPIDPAEARKQLRGGSLPPLDPPNAGSPLPRWAATTRHVLPRQRMGAVEIAEGISIPVGLHGQASPSWTELPKTISEARLLFTHMTRDLGKRYRLEFKTELKTDVAGVEAIQKRLRQLFPDGRTQTHGDLQLVRQHGAFMSEMLIRRLGAEWTDLTPTELGYWEMTVPTSTRIWPFGRIFRHLTSTSSERDLVGYYLELEARARVASTEMYAVKNNG